MTNTPESRTDDDVMDEIRSRFHGVDDDVDPCPTPECPDVVETTVSLTEPITPIREGIIPL